MSFIVLCKWYECDSLGEVYCSCGFVCCKEHTVDHVMNRQSSEDHNPQDNLLVLTDPDIETLQKASASSYSYFASIYQNLIYWKNNQISDLLQQIAEHA